MNNRRPTIKEAFINQFNPKKLIIRLLDLKAPSLNSILKTALRLGITGLFLVIILLSLYDTGWNVVEELPQNIADQSNIKALGILIFTTFVVPFEVLSIVLLSSLIGAIYMAKGDEE